MPALPHVPGYRLDRLLGGGGFAEVYAAQPDAGGAAVALKLALRPGDPRFVREAAALRLLAPPVAPALLAETASDDGRPALVLELIDAPTLDAWLRQRGPVPPADARAPAAALCAAVTRMHGAGVVHRDLKPENLFLRRGGEVTLIDFGLAGPRGALGGAPGDPELTGAGQIVGTPLYMAPEQWLDPSAADARADQYSLATVLFLLLTGRTPFAGATSELAQAHALRRPQSPSRLAQLPGAVDQVLLRALAKQPEDRFTSVAALAQALDAALAGGAAAAMQAAPPAAPATRARAADRRSVALLAIAGDAPPPRLAELATAERGQLERVYPGRRVLAWPELSPRAGVGAAARVAARLGELAAAQVLHVASLRVRARADGVTVAGAALDSIEPWARLGELPGGTAPLVTDEAAAWLPPARLLATARPGLWTLAGDEPPDATHFDEPTLRERDALLATLAAEARLVVERREPALCTLLGASGLGKSALLRAAVTPLTELGFQIWRVQADRPPHHGAESPLAGLLLAALGLEPEPDAASIDAACAAQLGEAAAELAPAVAHALGAVTAGDSRLAPVIAAPGALTQLTARALAESLRAAAARAGAPALALAVDDADRGDPALLDALELATMEAHAGVAAAPLLILAAARPALLETRAAWGDRAVRGAHLELAPLGAEAAAALCAEQLRPVEHAAAPLLAHLVHLAGGVPAHLVELAHVLRSGGAVRRMGATDAWFLAAEDVLALAPGTLTERLAARVLERMPPPLRSFAQLCALLGEPLLPEQIAAVQALGPEGDAGQLDTGAALRRLSRLGLVREHPPGAWRFDSPLLRAGLESLLPPGERRAWHHAALACHLAGRGDGTLEDRARHASACGARDQAARAWSTIAEQAIARHADPEAERALTAALDALDEQATRERRRALAARGKVRGRLRRFAEARGDLAAARAIAERDGDTAGAAALLLEEATVLDWAFEFAGSAELAARAAAMGAGAGDARLRARTLFALGRTEYRAERLVEAIALLDEAADAASGAGDYETRVLALLLLGPALSWTGQVEPSEARFTEVIELCRRAGDHLHLGVAYANRMTPWAQRERPERVLADAQSALAMARECGNVDLERVTQYNLAELLEARGDLDAALAAARRSRQLQLRAYERPGPEDSLLCARLLATLGRGAEARELLEWVERSCPAESVSESQRQLIAKLRREIAGD